MKNKSIIYILFVVYFILMIWLLFIQRIEYVNYENYNISLSKNINLIPFKTIIEYVNADSVFSKHAFINLAGNIIMFIPLGFFLPCLSAHCRKLSAVLLHTAMIILIVELIQLFTLTGSLDIDDILLNTTGSGIGYMFQSLIFKNKH